MKVAVLGGEGQLGVDVVRAFAANGDDVASLRHCDVELADQASVSAALRAARPDLLINTAAMHQVEDCEADPARAFAVNALGVWRLAQAAQEAGCALMHVSTDYVFDGAKGSPYREGDAPRPLNAYGNSKLAGEYFVRAAAEKHFVLRTSAIYGTSPCRAKGGLNFIQLMLKLAKTRGEVHVVDDEFVTPTSTRELARQMLVLSRTTAYGLYHATAEGACTWLEFAGQIFALTGTEAVLKPARPGEFPAKTPRPKYSVLENQALKNLGLNTFRPWQEGLREYLNGDCAPESRSR
ncbi:MAG TPA: dTDP-4-dehydrorhamnose reductase [Bryobacteraceae bacterium]|nr:dTDP-4-dehydrorhamnose reductase [Bryobacteraceae bacterium]